MWTSVRSTAARQLRVSRAAKVNTGLSVSSRVAIRPASFVVSSPYRLLISSRSFSDTSDQAAAKAAAKPAVKKSKTAAATKKPAAKKATAGKKTAAKKAKPVAKKAAPKKPAKKVLDPEAKRKLEIRELKKIALLDKPKQLPGTAYMVYNQQNSEKGKRVADAAKERATEYHSLSPSEKARLEITATENRLVNKTAYKNWVESHDPVAIDAANRARRRLRRISPDHKDQRDIKDDRLPKLPATPYALYVASRYQTGEYAGQSFKDAQAGIHREWKSLDAAEKKEFEDRYAADKVRYANDVKAVLHREVRSSSPP